MSEEKPTFKVTDRRLFNPDGTPRGDIPREPERPQDPPPAPAPSAAHAGARPDASVRDAAGQNLDAAVAGGFFDELGAEDSARAGAGVEQRQRGPADDSRRGGANDARGAESADPTPFANLVMFIASPAAAAMGMTEHPGLAPGEIDLPLAKHCIDLLATVRDKSRGNLSQQEQQILEGLLAELRMQYVSLTSAPRPGGPPRGGFTGGDITGGR